MESSEIECILNFTYPIKGSFRDNVNKIVLSQDNNNLLLLHNHEREVKLFIFKAGKSIPELCSIRVILVLLYKMMHVDFIILPDRCLGRKMTDVPCTIVNQRHSVRLRKYTCYTFCLIISSHP